MKIWRPWRRFKFKKRTSFMSQFQSQWHRPTYTPLWCFLPNHKLHKQKCLLDFCEMTSDTYRFLRILNTAYKLARSPEVLISYLTWAIWPLALWCSQKCALKYSFASQFKILAFWPAVKTSTFWHGV